MSDSCTNVSGGRLGHAGKPTERGDGPEGRVVGGGSTYTPELVDGIRASLDRLAGGRARPLRHRCGAARDRRRSGRADAAAAGWAGRADRAPTIRDEALDGADFVLVQLRVGGQAARLVDETLPPRVRHASARRPPGQAASPRRCGPCRWCSDIAEEVGPPSGAGRVDRRLHQPGRHRHPGAAGRGPPRDRAVQRRDRLPAAVREAVRGRARARPAGARRPQPPDVGARGAGSTASTACRSCSATDAEVARASGRLAGRARPGAARDPLVLPALLLPDREVLAEQRSGHTRAQEVMRHRARAARAVPRPDARQRSRSCSSTAAAPTTARPRRSSIASLHDGKGDIQVVERRNDGACRTCRRRGRRGAGADRRGTAPSAAPRAAGAGSARPRPGDQGVRGAGDQGGSDRRPGDRPAGAARATR